MEENSQVQQMENDPEWHAKQLAKSGFRIVELKIKNFKRIKAITIKPGDENTVIISGKNEQGKTSVLDAIFVTIGGGEARKGLLRPIRDGQKSSKIEIDMGDMIVTRRWTANHKTYITVESKDKPGKPLESPQAVLDSLIGNFSFDPLSFSKMPDKKQKDILFGLDNIDFDLEKWEKERNIIFENRKDLNRDIKSLKIQINETPLLPVDTPDEETSTTTVLLEQEEAQTTKTENDTKRENLEDEHENRRGLDERKRLKEEIIKGLNEEIAEINLSIVTSINKIRVSEEEVKNLIDPDMDSFSEKLKNLEIINANVREKKKSEVFKKMLSEKTTQSEVLTGNLEVFDDKKTEAIKAAKFPIEGLSFDDEGVTYKGIPFCQCSSSERLKVSLSMAMALNPKLRVLRIMDGSLLDSANMQIIKEMVKDNGYQVWIEKVDETGKVGIVIEDGEVLKREDQEVARKAVKTAKATDSSAEGEEST
jgi:hypothetical protein